MDNAEKVAAIFYELFDYSPDTGVVHWKKRPLSHFSDERAMKIWNTRYAGNEVLKESANGYIHLNVKVGSNRIAAYLHRVIWIVHYGSISKGNQVDHINGLKKDNRLENLRLCEPRQNSYNMKKREGVTSKYKGVCWNKVAQKWIANIKIKGKQTYLGAFKSEEDARDAYQEKARELHGQFYTSRGNGR